MSVFERFVEKHRKHHTHPNYLATLRGAMGMLRDPEHTESVFDIEDGLRHIQATREAFDFTAQDPRVREMIEERYLQPVPATARLRQLDPGTLGRTYVDHLDSMGFDPDYYRKIDVKDDIDYILMRIRQTHDIWHVVTGLDTTQLGEISVKAVELAQTHRPMSAVICAGGVFRYLMKEPEQFGDCLKTISMGYQIGLKAKPLLAMKWEEQWERPVDEIRADLDVEPLAPNGAMVDLMRNLHQPTND